MVPKGTSQRFGLAEPFHQHFGAVRCQYPQSNLRGPGPGLSQGAVWLSCCSAISMARSSSWR
jgi:hypothetical protein